MIYWGGPEGPMPGNITEIMSRGPHGMNVRDLGNRYDRGLYEDYISSAHQMKRGERPVSISWKAETPFNTTVKFQIRTANSRQKLEKATWQGSAGPNSWFEKSGSKIHRTKGQWIQYRARLTTPNGGPTPYLSSVSISFK